jgi:hypothetical protein
MTDEIMQEAAPQTSETSAETSNAQQVETSTAESSPQATNQQTATDATSQVERKIEPDWRPDWLDKMAGSDEKAKNILGRYGSPKAVGEALLAAQKKISSYKPQIELPENPTPEDVAKYRKAYGIPETPDKYDLNLDNGLVIGEQDMPLVQKFLERAHARNAKSSEVKQTLQDHFENLQAENEAINKRFQEQTRAAEDELRAEWGQNFRQNANVISNFMTNKFGEEVFRSLSGAILADGTRLDSNPKVLRAFLQIAQDVDPVATLGGSAGQTAQSISSELVEIEKVMSANPSKYHADKNLVKRYEELMIANEKIKSRS